MPCMSGSRQSAASGESCQRTRPSVIRVGGAGIHEPVPCSTTSGCTAISGSRRPPGRTRNIHRPAGVTATGPRDPLRGRRTLLKAGPGRTAAAAMRPRWAGRSSTSNARPVGSSTLYGSRRHQAAMSSRSRLAASDQRANAGWQATVGHPAPQVNRFPARQAPGVTSQPCRAYRNAAALSNCPRSRFFFKNAFTCPDRSMAPSPRSAAYRLDCLENTGALASPNRVPIVANGEAPICNLHLKLRASVSGRTYTLCDLPKPIRWCCS